MSKTNVTDPRRARLIKIIHVARREIGIDDDSYRQMLANMPALGGRTSSVDVGLKGLELILKQLKARGFKVRAKVPKSQPKVLTSQDRPLADDKQSKMIRGLWLELHSLGAVRDPSEKALAAYVCRIAKIEALQWLDIEAASKVIETLKKWRYRTIKKGTDNNKELDAK
jgi:phage gp16-like protein